MAKGLGPEMVDPALSSSLDPHQARLTENPQVLRGRRLARADSLDDLAHRSRALDQEVENLPSRLLPVRETTALEKAIRRTLDWLGSG